MGKIVLASSSPRRCDIMRKEGYKFEVKPSPYEEKHTTTDFSYSYIENLAYEKAKAVSNLVEDESIVIGADTVVVLNNKILGKPHTIQNAFNMLKTLSGKKHFVVTSIAIINSKTGKTEIKSTTSYVEFEQLSDAKINEYIDKYKPLDKAGSYGIQEMPEGYIKSYDGDLENIIGLPSTTLKNMLKDFLN